MIYGSIGIGFDGLFSYTFYRNVLVFLVFLPLALSYPLYKKKELKEKRLRRLSLEFKEAITSLSASLSAGYSVENALNIACNEMKLLFGKDAMITDELLYMAQQIQTNTSFERALGEFADRSGLEDVENFAEVFTAAKRSGGQLVGIIKHSVDIIREKIQIREEIITLTASRQFEQKIMNLIPFFLIIYVDETSPGFFRIMYETMAGRAVMTICLGIYITAYVMAKKILSIEI